MKVFWSFFSKKDRLSEALFLKKEAKTFYLF